MTDHPDDLLTPRPAAPDPAFRDALFRRTLAAVRRRVWGRRLALVAALAACFTIGVGTMYFVSPPPPDFVPPLLGGPEPTQPRLSATAFEDQAIQKPELRATAFREAGQRYLSDEGDVQSALRCYRHSLDADAELAVDPDDDWLLIALKHARQEERRHVHND